MAFLEPPTSASFYIKKAFDIVIWTFNRPVDGSHRIGKLTAINEPAILEVVTGKNAEVFALHTVITGETTFVVEVLSAVIQAK